MAKKTKLLTLGEIVKHLEHPLMQDVLLNHQSDVGDELKCIRCKKTYKRGDWDFYSLCNDCFSLFDYQKMVHRFGQSKEGTESAKEWINNNPYEKPKK